MRRSSLVALSVHLLITPAIWLLPISALASWNAQWITAADVEWRTNEPNAEETSEHGPQRAKANQWHCFRRQISLDSLPKEAKARVACDSKYWLWVNGELVVFEGQLKRGPAPGDTYYDIVDLTSHMRVGENTIAILVWYFGKHGFSHQDSGRPGLLLELEHDDQLLTSNANWRARRHPAFGTTGKPHPNYRLPESNVRFDARDDIVGWQESGFDDTAWPQAVEAGRPTCAPWNALVVRPIPLWFDSGLRSYANASELPSESDGELIAATLPYNAQVTPYLKIDAQAGQKIDIRTDNYRGGGPPSVRTEYITRDGVQEFETPGWMNGHAVVYDMPPGIKILGLKYRETGYNTNFTGHFQCDDESLNTLWRKAQRTLYVTMRDTYMDCPDRERAQWWGDEVIELGEAFYALDPASHHLARKGILELARWQRPGGEMYSPVPSGNWDKELPTQMLASVGPYGFWTYYWHTGDAATIENVYSAVKKYLDLWQLGEDGLVVARTGGWTWGDWGVQKDMPLLFNGWYYLALESLAKMADLTGHPEDASSARAKRKVLHASFNDNFWCGNEYRSPDYTGQTDDRGHALAVVAGLADSSKYPAIRDVFSTQRHASPYMEKYVLEALFRMGYADDAMMRMKQRYQAMIDSPLTTLWEGWGIGEEGFGGGTYNHAWSGGPLTLLSQFVAGIEPLQPAYREFAVRPQLGSLTNVEATVDSVAGQIDVAIHRDEKTLRIVLSVPTETTALVTLPPAYKGDLRLNDRPLPIGGETRSAKDMTVQPGERVVRLQAGKWQIDAAVSAE